MMRTAQQPLAHLVDAAAEKWLAAEAAEPAERAAVYREITDSFRIGRNPELTFHGLNYLLSIIRTADDVREQDEEFRIEVHTIAHNG